MTIGTEMQIVDALAAAAIRGAGLFVAAAAVAWLFRRRAAATRHAVWATALGLQLALPLLGSVLPRWKVAVLRQEATVPASIAPEVKRGPTSSSVISPATSAPTNVMALEHALSDGIRRSSPPEPVRILLMAWLIGASAVLLRLILGTARVTMLALRARRVTDDAWLTLTSDIASVLRIRRPVKLLQGDKLAVPVTWGVLHPVVLLPADADAWPDERRRVVLVHEMAHVKRLDAVTQLIGQSALAAFWFNPLVWLATRRMQLEREHACDDSVLRYGATPSAYASDLLDLVRSIGSANHRAEAPAFAALAMARRSEFEGRLLSILDPSVDRAPMNRAGVVMATVAAFLFTIPLAAFTPIARPTLRVSTTPASTPLASTPPASTPPASTLPPTTEAKPKSMPVAETTMPAKMPAETTKAVVVPAAVSAATIEECDTWFRGSQGTRVNVHSDNSRPQAQLVEYSRARTGLCLEARLTGEVAVSDDERDIVDLPRGASVYMRERTPSADRQLTVTSDGRGGFNRVYKVNGQTAAYDDDARRWFADILPMVFREAGIDAPKRVARLRREGGVTRVLSMIGSIQSSGGRSAHYEALLDAGSLTSGEIEQILRQVRQDLSSSSGDMRTALSKVPIRQVVGAGARQSLADALTSIESDGDKTEALTQIALETDNADILGMVGRVAQTIVSDGDKSRFLTTTAATYLTPKADALRSVFFQTAGGIRSDGDKRRVLVTAAPYGHADQGVTESIIRATSGIESSGDQAAVLTTLATQRLIVTPALKDAFLKAADSIDSEGDRSRVLRAVLQP